MIKLGKHMMNYCNNIKRTSIYVR